jgi:hypothetical protein
MVVCSNSTPQLYPLFSLQTSHVLISSHVSFEQFFQFPGITFGSLAYHYVYHWSNPVYILLILSFKWKIYACYSTVILIYLLGKTDYFVTVKELFVSIQRKAGYKELKSALKTMEEEGWNEH